MRTVGLGLEGGEEAAEGLAAVAVEIFFFARDFGEGFAEGREEEDWVVAEAGGALGTIEEDAIDLRGDYDADFAALGCGDDADEMGSAGIAFAATHGVEEFRDAVGVGGVGAGVAGGVDAGGAGKRRDDEAGIVGDDQVVGEAGVVEGFAEGVFGEGGEDFVEGREGGEIWE
jgi:hypothetical protein